ncbi:putative LPS assembly protein LptD [Riemerella columbipharyngis]|uniref:LPS assembly outer membrane protein LptD (Organic solvent tolerance protein OstA) n=1 Tax=Riemerella columbipharyngis TaxID=1071918 RepID=A0A1G7D4Q7_9FLAO|nr:putative LPS assembly protein LptD [Riemerella columbipharyngis]SDE46582.1 LPS assembly outer membrane protein LptD (organic solvent tolerance protein OstA) [Riemerella columbipharyngis]
MAKNGFKNTLQILIILIFNSFFAQQKLATKKTANVGTDEVSTKDSLKSQKEELEGTVKCKALNMSNDIPKKMTFLQKNAEIQYMDMTIEADYISINWETGDIYARGEIDKNGKIIKPAASVQAGQKYEYNEVKFNFKTRKAIAYNARTEEQEGVIVAQKTKKVNDSVFYMRNGLYTTDDYFIKKKDTVSDYYLLAQNIKLVKGRKSSKVITGPIQMYVERVPTPLVLPFAILPFSSKRSAGLLIPSFGERIDVGFFLNNLGYYQPIGDHFDLKVYTDFYTKGSWNIRPELSYRNRYKYSGSFSADIGNTVRGIKGLSDYSKSRTYRIAWTHTQDSKANPFFNFSASVDIVSSKFYNNTINNNYIFNQNVLNTQQNSSISVTKRFLNLPITVTGSASYSQNFATGETNIRLPQLNVAVNQFYLFNPKSGVREGLLQNINVNTSLNFNNYVNTNQNEVFTKRMWDKMQTGVQIPLSISTNTTVFKYFTFSLGVNMQNVLTTKTLQKSYNPILNVVENTYNKGLAGYSTFSTSASLQTVLYGQKNFRKGASIQAVRHMITPSVGFSYTPDFGNAGWGYYKNFYDASGAQSLYSIFDGTVFGSPSRGLSESISFNINNNLEMKVRSRKDSLGVKKIKIFENLNISGSYNFAAPKFKWSVFSISTQSSFFKNKLNINTSLSLDPYKIVYHPGSDVGERLEQFGHFSIQNFNVQMSFPLNNELFTGDEKKDYAKLYKKKGAVMGEAYYFDDDGYAHFSQPWSLNVNSTYSYTRSLSRFGSKVATVGIDGSIALTPYWNITGSTNYDFIHKELAYTRLGFSRNQRSFTINFNWVPFGRYKVYDFYIGIKANILKDAVKYQDRSFPQTSNDF